MLNLERMWAQRIINDSDIRLARSLSEWLSVPFTTLALTDIGIKPRSDRPNSVFQNKFRAAASQFPRIYSSPLQPIIGVGADKVWNMHILLCKGNNTKGVSALAI
jgi:hypothetical protein